MVDILDKMFVNVLCLEFGWIMMFLIPRLLFALKPFTRQGKRLGQETWDSTESSLNGYATTICINYYFISLDAENFPAPRGNSNPFRITKSSGFISLQVQVELEGGLNKLAILYYVNLKHFPASRFSQRLESLFREPKKVVVPVYSRVKTPIKWILLVM